MKDERGPIFIGGLSHSGKTELRMILGAHPDICMTRRTYMWDRFYGRFGDLDLEENVERCLSAMLAEEGLRDLRIDRERVRAEFGKGTASYARLFGLVHQHHAERLGNRRWGDQLGYIERFADPIFETFDSARLIHMIRDPRARYAERAARSPRRRGALGLETAMWLHSAALADRNRRRHPVQYLVVRFEEMAADPVRTAQEVCSFIGEKFTPAMHAVAADITFDASSFDVEGSPTPRGVSSPESAFVGRYAKRALLSFQYPVPEARMSLRARLSFLLVDWPLNRATMTAWSIVDGSSRPRARS
jgi:hypothetical protein